MLPAVVNTVMNLRVVKRFVSQKNVVGSVRCSGDFCRWQEVRCDV